MNHIAGPVRRGSRQITQRCLRCGYPLILESAGLDDMAVGYEPGSVVQISESGDRVVLDDVYRRLPPVRLCDHGRKGKQRIRVK